MKNNKFAKISLIIFALALCFCAIFAMTADAADPAKPQIVSQNIEYGVDYKIQYAVKAEGITGPVTLKVYNTYPESDSVLPILTLENNTPETIEQLGISAYVFTTNAISHLNMTDMFYVTAETVTNGVSAVKRYSVAEYLYERLADVAGKTDDLSVKQRELYNNTIAYGTNLQELVTPKAETEDELIKNLRYVVVKGGKLDKYFTAGVYPLNSTLPLTADDPTVTGVKWSVTPWKDGNAGTALKNQSSVTVTDDDVIAVEFGESVVITYRDGYNNLDKINAGATWGSGSYNSNAFTKKGDSAFVTMDGRGTVIQGVNLDNSGSNQFDIISHYDANYPDRNVNNNEYSAETGTAFEVSFDIKLNTSGDGDDNIRLNLCTGYGDRKYIVYLYQYEDGVKRTTLKVANYAASSESREFDVDPSEWFHIRLVAYKSSYNADVQKLYIYINGDNSNPLVMETPQVAGDFFASFTRLRVSADTDSTEDGCYIDNVFIGYTNETEPTLN